MRDNDDVVMMLTEKGFRILLQELSGTGAMEKVVEKSFEEEVDDLVGNYMDYKQENYNDNGASVVVEYLKTMKIPVKLKSIRDHLRDNGVEWSSNSSTTNMKTIMKNNPNIRRAGFGEYVYV